MHRVDLRHLWSALELEDVLCSSRTTYLMYLAEFSLVICIVYELCLVLL
jgi:hypothetical protein